MYRQVLAIDFAEFSRDLGESCDAALGERSLSTIAGLLCELIEEGNTEYELAPPRPRITTPSSNSPSNYQVPEHEKGEEEVSV